MNEAETCRTLVRPKLETAGWLANGERHYREQLHITAGRVVLAGGTAKRRQTKIPDYLLYFRRDMPLAVVEAKSNLLPAGNGLQQGKEYATLLGLKFAYSTNGAEIIEYDAFTQNETVLTAYPTPEELLQRYQVGMGFSSAVRDALLVPDFFREDKQPRYYQRIAIDSAIRAVVGGQKRCLLTLATGTGKTTVAFQICWKLWSAKWNAKKDPTRKPRMLFLADRDKLVSDPMSKDFAPFQHARHRISGKAERGREMYFALYQALAGDETRPGLFRDYPPDYFDLIVIDECHRGSANDESRWRDILTYFHPAYQLGMTATPMREDNRDSYAYFGNPLYTYSLKQGIEDGFLAPYRLHRVVTSFDATGWRPNKGQKDKHGEEIPDRLYNTKDFERVVSVEARNKIAAKHISDFLRSTNRYAKTIVFCVDQDHAEIMRHELHMLNKDLAAEAVGEGTEYAARVVSDEGDIGKGFLDQFQDPEKRFPVILTTSQLLTTGVDAPTCKNVVLFRMVNSMTEFKQIIGRGTRLREDHGKMFFNILDYNGSANEKFADPAFDGEPALATQSQIDEAGNVTIVQEHTDPEQNEDENGGGWILVDPPEPGVRKYRVHGGLGGIASVDTHDLAADGSKLRTANLTVFTGEEVRGMAPDAAALRALWAKPVERAAVLKALDQRGIDLHVLGAEARRLREDAFSYREALWASEYRWAFRLDAKQFTVEQVCEQLIDYRGRTPPIADEGIPHLTSANVKKGWIDWQTPKYVTEDTYQEYMTRGIPVAGDVLFTMEAPLGNAAVLPDARRFSLAQRTLLLRPNRQLIEPRYLAAILMCPSTHEVILSKSTGTTVKGIASKRLRHVALSVPPLDEQRRIVAHLDALQAKLDAVRAVQSATAAELDALLPSVLNQAFAGRL